MGTFCDVGYLNCNSLKEFLPVDLDIGVYLLIDLEGWWFSFKDKRSDHVFVLTGNTQRRMNQLIREAEPADKDAIQSLYQALCPGAPVNVLPERILELKNDPNNFLLVHEIEGEITGTVFLTVCLSPMFGFQPYGVIEYFIVNEKYRRQGIGSQLTDHVTQLCREKKCTRIILISNDHRKAAHALYESKGFSSTGKVGYVKYLNRK